MNSFLPEPADTGRNGKELIVKHHPLAREMREQPDLEQLKRQAKELLEAFRNGDTDAITEVNAHYPGANPADFALHDAQLVLARSYGFESWPKLKAYVDGVTVQRLVEHVSANDMDEVRAMLHRRPELANMQISYGNESGPLHFAVMGRLPEMVRLLMQHGADARSGIHPHRDATEALTLAVERGFSEIEAIILEEEQHRRASMSPGESVTSAQDDLSETILRDGEARAIDMLEAHPELAHGTDRDGWTPLHLASAVRSPSLVVWLLQHGAQINRRSKDGRTPLDLAVDGRRPIDPASFAAVANLLLDAGAELTIRAAVALGRSVWLRARHAEQPLVNPITWERGGLLTVAVRHNRPDMLSLLLDFGFDPDERVRLSTTDHASWSQAFPLWQCAALGRLDMAETLLQRGANPNVHLDSSGTAVHSAFSHRQWPMVELLRHYGGIVGADTAAIYRQTDLARQILAADPSAVRDLLNFGAMGGDPETVRLALDRTDWPRSDPRWFSILAQPLSFWNHMPGLSAANPVLDRGTYIDCFRQILDRSDPNMVAGFGRTMLHEVAAMGHYVTDEEAEPFVRALLQAGADTRPRDTFLSSTPLGWACRWGRLSVARALLEAGADPLEADAEPWARPKAWAEKMGHAALLALLNSR